jgi:hypothetical protein
MVAMGRARSGLRVVGQMWRQDTEICPSSPATLGPPLMYMG